MLRKLMKYELTATARIFLLLSGTVLALGLLNKLFFMMGIFGGNLPFPVELTAGLTMMMYFFVIGAIFVMTLIITIQRFYKNLLGDEGYLMFTLPVKPWQHIVSKMTVAIFWFIVSVFVTIFSGLMIGISFELLAELPDIFSQIMGEFYEYFPLALFLLGNSCFMFGWPLFPDLNDLCFYVCRPSFSKAPFNWLFCFVFRV